MNGETTGLYVLSLEGQSVEKCYENFFEEFVVNSEYGDERMDIYFFGRGKEPKELNILYPVDATVVKTAGIPPKGEHNFVLIGKENESIKKVSDLIKSKGFKLEGVVLEGIDEIH